MAADKLHVVSVIATLATCIAASANDLSRCTCNASSLLQVNSPDHDYTPAVVLGANFKMSFDFTGSCTSPVNVTWSKTTAGTTYTLATEVSEHSYTAVLSIMNTTESTYGRYTANICNTLVQQFTVFPRRKDCGNGSALTPVPQNISPPLVVPNWGTKSVNLSCLFFGITSPSRYAAFWNVTQASKTMVLQGGNKYSFYRKIKDDSTCYWISTVAINKVTTMDTGNYTCYPWSLAANVNYKPDVHATELLVIDFPQVEVSLPLEQQISTADCVLLQWTIKGSYQHTVPLVLVDGKVLSTSNVTKIPNDLINHFTVKVKISELPVGKHSVQLYALLNDTTISDIYDYNSSPNTTTPYTVTVTQQAELKTVVPSIVVPVVVIIIIIFIIIIVFLVCWRVRRAPDRSPSKRTGYMPIQAGGPKQVFILNDSSTDEETQDLNDILNQFSTNSDGTPAYKCECIPHHNEIIDDWTNWVVLQITQSHHVLLVCSTDMKRCLEQSDSIKINITHGELFNTTILNAIREKPGKFSLIFLNQLTDNSDLIPMDLKSNRQYSVNTEEVRALRQPDMTKEDLADAVQRYMKTSKGKDLKNLFQMLR